MRFYSPLIKNADMVVALKRSLSKNLHDRTIPIGPFTLNTNCEDKNAHPSIYAGLSNSPSNQPWHGREMALTKIKCTHCLN